MRSRKVILTEGPYLIGSFGRRAGTRDFCPALAALVGRIKNPVLASLHLRSPVHVVPTLPSRKPQSLAGKTQPLTSSGHVFRHSSSSHTCLTLSGLNPTANLQRLSFSLTLTPARSSAVVQGIVNFAPPTRWSHCC
jgi:hypothetical protein